MGWNKSLSQWYPYPLVVWRCREYNTVTKCSLISSSVILIVMTEQIPCIFCSVPCINSMICRLYFLIVCITNTYYILPRLMNFSLQLMLTKSQEYYINIHLEDTNNRYLLVVDSSYLVHGRNYSAHYIPDQITHTSRSLKRLIAIIHFWRIKSIPPKMHQSYAGFFLLVIENSWCENILLWTKQ